MAAIRQLLAAVPAYLEPGGLLVFEIGFGQAEAVRSEILTRPVWRFVQHRAGPGADSAHLRGAAGVAGRKGQ